MKEMSKAKYKIVKYRVIMKKSVASVINEK